MDLNKLLYIKANAKPKGQSRTFMISEEFIKTYMENNPNDEIITLDLYAEGIKPLSPEDLDRVLGTKTEESKNDPILKYTYQFAEADKYVIAAPMWNLSFPAILKAYIDYICVAGITFRYTSEGPVGLLNNKKAVYITTRGGDYSSPRTHDLEMGERYIRTIFTFLGITHFTTIAANKLDIASTDAASIINKAIDEARKLAKDF